MSDDYTHNVFADRAISPEVAEERGYRRFGGRNGLAPIFAADPRYAHVDEGGASFRWPDGQVRSFYSWSRRKVRGQVGWVMPKFAIPDSVFGAPPLAQLRPDEAVPGRSYKHEHSELSKYARLMHENGSAHRDFETGELLVPLEGEHEHVEKGKYLLPPGPHGKRWETHPRCTAAAFAKAERVILHLEGTLKIDSFVSAGEVGIDVPSVTMWDRRPEDFSRVDYLHDDLYDWDEAAELQASELERFLAAHVRAPVIVVCDSDWRHNPSVRVEAFCLRDFVLSAGLQCVVAAPEEGPYLRTDALGRRVCVKVGSDDFLAQGHRLEELLIVDPEIPATLRAYARASTRNGRGLSGKKMPGTQRSLDLLEWYATHTAVDGLLQVHPATVAHRLGVSPDTVRRATLKLQAQEAIRVYGWYADPDDREEPEEGWQRRTRRPRPPIIRLRPELRPNVRELTVGEWLETL